ncbi:NRDE family protein [Alcanivorax sp. 1008]|uniref:NRDE family protein n=1 Tax=Alcanivorax sp. 1008 TaxID=2816853 RepID=UPI001DD22379|nr:NRDE family protein [Alcanivorax sp. 1008]MCC1495999.1 NRDE family protein [Alcanivorax sp. 1008]
MCIVLFAWQVHDKHPLLVAANRDEFHHRPAEAARWRGDLLCGLDLAAGGTWLGVSRAGRFAAVTNYREPIADRLPGNRSRGMLPMGFLESELAPLEYLQGLQADQHEYGGFNLLVSNGRELAWMSNRGAEPQLVAPGIHALSNGQLDTDWPKAQRGQALLRQVVANGTGAVEPERLLQILEDDSLPDDDALPDTGVGLEMERLVAPIFIQSAAYGTRASTAVIQHADGRFDFAEQRWQPGGGRAGDPSRFD